MLRAKRAMKWAMSKLESNSKSNEQWQKTRMAEWLRSWTQYPLDYDLRGFESHFWYFFIGCPYPIPIIIPWETMWKWRKHPMSKCVSKSDLFYMMWHPLFPIISRSVYPWPHWFSRLWNNHGEYPKHVSACTDDVSVKEHVPACTDDSCVQNQLYLPYS